MTKKILILSLLAVFLLTASAAAELSKTAPIIEHKLIKGDEALPNVQAYPLNPGFATESPGLIVGTTYYDYQTNCSSGNRVIICDDGSKYFCWMNLLAWPVPRHVYHNWMNVDGVLNPNGFEGQVNEDVGAGYTNMDLIYGNRGAIAYHSAGGANPTNVTLSVDSDLQGFGFFDHYDPPDEIFPHVPGEGILLWPYIAVDSNDVIHIMSTEATTLRLSRMCYCNSTDGGNSWSALQFVDTVMVISSVVDASPVSDRVVVGYAKTQDTTKQYNNDIVYVPSEDGTTWDFRHDKVNITNYLDDNDSLWAYTDMDIIFDYNDYINVVWTASWESADGGYYYRTDIYHYSEETEEINIAVPTHVDSGWYDIQGAWNMPIAKMNLGASELGGLFMTYTRFDTTDISAGGFGNGEIYMVYSYDGGANWTAPENLTNSPTPGCYPGQCESDHWSTLADVVNDDTLHILYIEDKDAGGIPQTEGTATENPVRYLAHWIPTGIDEDNIRPVNFSLEQNYPNPFNANTVISFSLQKTAPVTVEVFDITGAKVAMLLNETMAAGIHEVVWDASDVASGVYFYKLSTGDVSESRQMVLIK